MAAKAKFTFKLHKKETGLAGVGHCHQGAHIKLNKKIVGDISAPSWRQTQFKAGLMVKKSPEELAESPNCDWKWIFFNKKTDTLEEMKDWLNSNIELFQGKYTFQESDE